MRFLRWNGHPDVALFIGMLNSAIFEVDAEMKCLQSLGKGAKKKQAEVPSEQDEDLLWEKGLLGG